MAYAWTPGSQAPSRTAEIRRRQHEWENAPRIYAVDEPDCTVYVLVVEGEVVQSAYWPQPLRELRPDALEGGTLGERLLAGAARDLLAVLDPWVRLGNPGSPRPLYDNRDCAKVGEVNCMEVQDADDHGTRIHHA